MVIYFLRIRPMLKAESHLLDFNGEFVVLQQKDKYDKGKPFLINHYNHKLLKIDRFVCTKRSGIFSK